MLDGVIGSCSPLHFSRTIHSSVCSFLLQILKLGNIDVQITQSISIISVFPWWQSPLRGYVEKEYSSHEQIFLFI